MSTQQAPAIPRLSNWESGWSTFIAYQRKLPLVWGQDDCMLMMGKNIEVLTGVDFYTKHVGKYDDETSAFAYLKSIGFATPEAYMDSILPQAPIAFAARGDIVSFGHCIGICLGRQSMFKDADNVDGTVEFVPTLECDYCWKIG